MSCSSLATQGIAAVAALCGASTTEIRGSQAVYDRHPALAPNEQPEELLADARACVKLLTDLGQTAPAHLTLDNPSSKLAVRYGRLYRHFTQKGWVNAARAEGLRRRAQAAAQAVAAPTIPRPLPDAPARPCIVGRRGYQIQATGDPERPYVLVGSRDKLVAVPDPEQPDQLRLLNKAGQEQGRLTRDGGLFRTPSGGVILASAIAVPAGQRRCGQCGQWRGDEHPCSPVAAIARAEIPSTAHTNSRSRDPRTDYGFAQTQEWVTALSRTWGDDPGPVGRQLRAYAADPSPATLQATARRITSLARERASLRVAEGLALHPDAYRIWHGQATPEQTAQILAVAERILEGGPLPQGHHLALERCIEALAEGQQYVTPPIQQLADAIKEVARLYPDDTARLAWQERYAATPAISAVLGNGDPAVAERVIDSLYHQERMAFETNGLSQLELHEAREGMGRGDGFTRLHSTVTGRDHATRSDTTGLTNRTLGIGHAYSQFFALNTVIARQEKAGGPITLADLPLTPELRRAIDAALAANGQPTSPPGSRTAMPLRERFATGFAAAVQAMRVPVEVRVEGERATVGNLTIAYEPADGGRTQYTNGWAIRDPQGKEVAQMGDLGYIAARAACHSLTPRLEAATKALPAPPPKEDEAGRAAYVTRHVRECLAGLGLANVPEVQAVLAEMEPRIPNKLWTRESMQQVVADIAYQVMIDGAENAVQAAWGEPPKER